MAQEFDELYSRSRQRRQQRAQKAQARRRSRVPVLAALAAAGICVLLGIVLLTRQTPQDPTVSTAPETTQSTQAPTQVITPTEPETVITIAAAGDLNVTDLVVASGAQNGWYDYQQAFLQVAPLLAQADCTVLNFEGNLCGAPYGSLYTSAPQELAQALADAGVDMVQLANSCTVNNGLTGLTDTLNGIRSAGLEPLGAFASREEFQQTQGFTIRSIGGIRVAFVAFTKGVGSLGLPAGSQDRVNLLYKDYSSTYQDIDTEGITAILNAVQEQKPDVTIAMLHWGSEYNDKRSSSQDKIVQLLQDNGVDAILGTHPHYVQSVSYDPDTGRVVAYSLGDFFGDGQKTGTNYSIILQLEITKNNQTGQCRITGCDYEPIYLLTPERDGLPLQLVQLRQAIDLYENDHVDKVSPETYQSMLSALARIEARVQSDS